MKFQVNDEIVIALDELRESNSRVDESIHNWFIDKGYNEFATVHARVTSVSTNGNIRAFTTNEGHSLGDIDVDFPTDLRYGCTLFNAGDVELGLIRFLGQPPSSPPVPVARTQLTSTISSLAIELDTLTKELDDVDTRKKEIETRIAEVKTSLKSLL